MTDRIYAKKCNAQVLDAALRAAAFLIEGVSTSDNTTIVHLKDGEAKDPGAVVAAHVYTPPVERNWKAEYAAAGTTTQKFSVIAERLGLV